MTKTDSYLQYWANLFKCQFQSVRHPYSVFLPFLFLTQQLGLNEILQVQIHRLTLYVGRIWYTYPDFCFNVKSPGAVDIISPLYNL